MCRDQEKLKELQQQADAARMAAEGIESELAAQASLNALNVSSILSGIG